jgi:hypothetical protein
MEANYHCRYLCNDYKNCKVYERPIIIIKESKRQLKLELSVLEKLENELKILKFEQLFEKEKGNGHDPTPLHDGEL